MNVWLTVVPFPRDLITCSFATAEASKLMSAEHKALGYRPPANSLAAQAQRAAAAHPNTKPTIDPAVLADAALKVNISLHT